MFVVTVSHGNEDYEVIFKQTIKWWLAVLAVFWYIKPKDGFPDPQGHSTPVYILLPVITQSNHKVQKATGRKKQKQRPYKQCSELHCCSLHKLLLFGICVCFHCFRCMDVSFSMANRIHKLIQCICIFTVVSYCFIAGEHTGRIQKH